MIIKETCSLTDVKTVLFHVQALFVLTSTLLSLKQVLVRFGNCK